MIKVQQPTVLLNEIPQREDNIENGQGALVPSTSNVSKRSQAFPSWDFLPGWCASVPAEAQATRYLTTLKTLVQAERLSKECQPGGTNIAFGVRMYVITDNVYTSW